MIPPASGVDLFTEETGAAGVGQTPLAPAGEDAMTRRATLVPPPAETPRTAPVARRAPVSQPTAGRPPPESPAWS